MNSLRVLALGLAATLGVAVLATPAASRMPPPEDPASGIGYEAGSREYEMKLRALEERVVGLKEAVFKAKTRLMLLQEEILQNVIAEARVVILHRNDMGSAFTLERVIYYLDTEQIYVQDNRGGQLDRTAEFEVFAGHLVPGNHLLAVEMEYRGNGSLFTYIDGYQFGLKANYTFFASKGRVTQIAVVGHQKGGMTTDLRERPAIKFQTQQFQYTKALEEPPGGGAAPAPGEAGD